MKGVGFRTRPRDLPGEAVAEADPADLDRRQRRCRDPARGADRRLLVHQPAQHAGDDRAADGSVQARARRVRPAVPGRSADAAGGLRREDARRGDPSRTALPRGEIQGLSRLGPGQGDARGRRFRSRLRRVAGRPLPAGLARGSRRSAQSAQPPARGQSHRRLDPLAGHAEQPRA